MEFVLPSFRTRLDSTSIGTEDTRDAVSEDASLIMRSPGHLQAEIDRKLHNLESNVGEQGVGLKEQPSH